MTFPILAIIEAEPGMQYGVQLQGSLIMPWEKACPPIVNDMKYWNGIAGCPVLEDHDKPTVAEALRCLLRGALTMGEQRGAVPIGEVLAGLRKNVVGIGQRVCWNY